MRYAIFAAVAMGAVAGCEPVSGPVSGPVVVDAGPNQCGAYDLQYLVGAPDRVLETMRFNKAVRIIQPYSAVTMDYNPERINFELDRYNMITRIFCG